jgi:hypothetical protein
VRLVAHVREQHRAHEVGHWVQPGRRVAELDVVVGDRRPELKRDLRELDPERHRRVLEEVRVAADLGVRVQAVQKMETEGVTRVAVDGEDELEGRPVRRDDVEEGLGGVAAAVAD